MAPEEKSFIGPNVATGGKAQEGGSQPTLLGQPEWLAGLFLQPEEGYLH